MPISLVWELELDIQRKVALTATFLHGIIGFIASVARLGILFHTNPAQDPDSTAAIAWTIWTINEPANYIIAACLPTLRPILVRILPEKMFFLARKRESNGENQKTAARTPEQGKRNVGSFLAWRWLRGSMAPKISLGSRGASRLTGPWDRSRWEDEEGKGPAEKAVQVSVRELRPDIK
ncbi:MAG: hypothetical protein Q9191_008500 [Dirinaria sp. TL-2023a]